MDLIKREIQALANVIMWIAFGLALNDPMFFGVREPGNAFATFSGVIDMLYVAVDWITMPVRALAELFHLVNPQAMGAQFGFPVASAAQVSQQLASTGFGGLFNATTFTGGWLWWVPITSVCYFIVGLVLPPLYDKLRNRVWNLFIEYVFQRKQTRLYAKELEESKANLAKLGNQYRTLAQETNSLKDSVITDELTKVFNKRFFLSRLNQEFDLCKQQSALFSIIMIDIDFFKRLNDTYGHLAGDQVLKSVGEVLNRYAPNQCYPCRYGGEEFAIIMPRKTSQEALEVAKLLQQNVQLLRFNDIDRKLVITISQGVCAIDFAMPESGEIKDYNAILELADKELYRSKIEGRNRISLYSLAKA